MKKKRILFPFVEAGMGHIMPLNAIAEAFEKKYGEEFEIIKTYFFQDSDSEVLKDIERDLIKQVKIHNKTKLAGFIQFLTMGLFGSKTSMKFVMEKRYNNGLKDAMDYLQSLDADLIVNTHFSTLYYSAKAKAEGLSRATVACYCPDPILGLQWDRRFDIMGISSEKGKLKAQKGCKGKQIENIPFMINRQVKDYKKSKAEYREEIGLQPDYPTILLADGAYGLGKLEKTVNLFLKSTRKLNLIVVCGKNEELATKLQQITPPDNIKMKVYGFTSEMIKLSAMSDIFIGKGGASNLAEVSYFGVPSIITFRATPVEQWIASYYVNEIGNCVLIENAKKAVATAYDWIDNPEKLQKYVDKCKNIQRSDGPEIFADILYNKISSNT